MTLRHWALPIVTIAALLEGAACSKRGARDVRVQPSRAPIHDSVFVEVTNDNYYDVRVHVIYQGGARHSVGTVGGNTRQSVVAIPWQPRALVVEVALIVRTGLYQSEALDVSAGDVLQVRVPPNLDASVFFRRVSRQ